MADTRKAGKAGISQAREERSVPAAGLFGLISRAAPVLAGAAAAAFMFPVAAFAAPDDAGSEAADTTAADTPTLSVVGADELELPLHREPPVQDLWRTTPSDWWEESLNGQLSVTVTNTGGASVEPEFSIVPTGAHRECAQASGAEPFEASMDDDVEAVESGEYKTYELSVKVDSDCVGQPAALVVTGTKLSPVTTDLAVTRQIGWVQFGPPLAAALAAAIIFAGVAFKVGKTKVDYRTPSGTAWSFSDSWLTSITVITTALTGVLTATGIVNELLPGVPLGHFLTLSLTFAAILLAAPLVFSIFTATDTEVKQVDAKDAAGQAVSVALEQKVSNGTVRGLFWAGAITCGGAAGVITMLMTLTLLSAAGTVSKSLVIVLLLVLLYGIARYAKRATKAALDMSKPAPGAPDRAAYDTVFQLEPQSTGFTGTL